MSFRPAAGVFAPELPRVVAPADPRLYLALSTLTGFAANQAKGTRAICPRGGVLTDLAVLINTQSGNISVGIYDTNGPNRTLLFTTGAIACPAPGWRVVAAGSLGVTVSQGQQIDMAMSADNATVNLQGINGINNNVQLPAGFWPAAGGAIPLLGWAVAGAHPLPNPLAEASMNVTGAVLPVICRIV